MLESQQHHFSTAGAPCRTQLTWQMTSFTLVHTLFGNFR